MDTGDIHRQIEERLQARRLTVPVLPSVACPGAATGSSRYSMTSTTGGGRRQRVATSRPARLPKVRSSRSMSSLEGEGFGAGPRMSCTACNTTDSPT